MTTDTESLGLTPDQHYDLGLLVLNGQNIRRAPAAAKPGPIYPGICRVISLTARTYDSRVATACPAFLYDRGCRVFTVEQIGSALAGYLVVTIGGVEFTVECRRENLADIVAAVPQLQRVEVFPGLWEFHFDPSSSLTVTVRNITLDENLTLCQLFDDIESCIYTGSAVVRQEYWRSVRDTAELATVDVVDSIPYLTGAVTEGAIGSAQFAYDAGWIVNGWQCRTFSHAVGYDQTTDPVPL